MGLTGGLAVLGVLFSTLAAIAAYLITYAEYARHYPDQRRPRRMALEAAVVAFVVFLALGLTAGLCLVRFCTPEGAACVAGQATAQRNPVPGDPFGPRPEAHARETVQLRGFEARYSGPEEES